MFKSMLLGGLLSLAIVAPACAFSVEQAPKNTDGTSRFADPDESLEAQASAYEEGRGGNWALRLGDGAAQGAASEYSYEAVPRRPRRDRNDHSCIRCESDLVDGLWVLRPADNAPAAQGN